MSDMDAQLKAICKQMLSDQGSLSKESSLYLVTADGRILAFATRGDVQPDLMSVGTLLAALIAVLEKLYGKPLRDSVSIESRGGDNFHCHPLSRDRFIFLRDVQAPVRLGAGPDRMIARLGELDSSAGSQKELDGLEISDVADGLEGFSEKR